jgi:hypothetical protein
MRLGARARQRRFQADHSIPHSSRQLPRPLASLPLNHRIGLSPMMLSLSLPYSFVSMPFFLAFIN